MSTTTKPKLVSRVETESLTLAQLYASYGKLVRSVIFKIAGEEELDDLVQETFLKVWKAKDQFKNASSLQTWIYRISTNTALDHCRKSKRAPRFSNGMDSNKEQAAQEAPQTDMRALVIQAMGKLSTDHRSALVLVLLDELTLQQASDVLNCPVGTVKSRLHYAKQELKNFFEQNGVEL